MSRKTWIDLSLLRPLEEVRTDVCIIGAGAAGLYLGSELSHRNIDVVMIEAGAASALTSHEIGFDPIFEDEAYPGATLGRYFGMGGTTTRWGGALVPHSNHDLRTGADREAEWMSIIDRVEANAHSVLSRLGYKNDPDFDGYAGSKCLCAVEALEHAGIDVQTNLLLPFRRKNLIGLLNSWLSTNLPRVFFNAVVKGWIPEACPTAEARISSLSAVSRNGNELVVFAQRFVIAAGAIESARILLEIDATAGRKVLRSGAAPGCYLADHLSLPIADVASDDRSSARALFAPCFDRSWMRGFRLLEKSPSTNHPRAFAHFIFSQDTSIGFAVAKELLGAFQSRRTPVIPFRNVMVGLGDLAALAYCRYLHSRLHVPCDSPIHLQLDMEQYADKENRVCLSALTDEYGRRRTSIRWRITENDMSAFAEAAERLLSLWPGKRANLPALIPREINAGVSKPHDAYHPVGTCRMGSACESVVDQNLKVWGVHNLWVVSTGVLPTAGTANPTFTMLCLAHHLAGNLIETR